MNQHTTNPCLICQSSTHYYFSKPYETYPNSPFPNELTVDYWKCGQCGFVVSKTHQDMSPEQWAGLNISWHHHFEDSTTARNINQPPYADQALALQMLHRNGLVDLGDTLDYAAGYGTLARVLSKYFDADISICDRYVHSDEVGVKYVRYEDLTTYKLVVNSAMFEHVLTRESLDELNRLVADDGVLMLHTVICENIPKDPSWFYLNPIVHTAFHTNASMEILMKQWGYAASIYSPQAKSWYLFKAGSTLLPVLQQKVQAINDALQTQYFHYKPGFVDYWKGF
jgi:Methyltransferase domain